MNRPTFRLAGKPADRSRATPDSGSTAARTTSTGRRRLAAVSVVAGVVAAGLLSAVPASAATGGTLARIKACESGGSYRAYNASSGASGAYQFLNSTWRGLPAARGYATAAAAPPAVQDLAARQLFASAGSTPWNASASCWRFGSGATVISPRSNSASSVGRVSSHSYRSQYRSTESDHVKTRTRRTTGFASHRYAADRDRHEGGNTDWGERSPGGGEFEHED